MIRSRWVYRKLRNFRTGIEADISYLKRAYSLARCTWRGLYCFRAYVWSSVVANNLALFARLKPPEASSRHRRSTGESRSTRSRSRLPPTPPPSPIVRVASATRAPQSHLLPRRSGMLTD